MNKRNFIRDFVHSMLIDCRIENEGEEDQFVFVCYLNEFTLDLPNFQNECNVAQKAIFELFTDEIEYKPAAIWNQRAKELGFEGVEFSD